MFKVNQVSHLQAKLHIKKATFALWKSGSVRSRYLVYRWTQILKHDTFSQASCRGKSLTCPAGWKSLLGGAGSKGQTPAPPLKDLSGKSSRTGRCKHHCPCKGVWLCLLFSDICLSQFTSAQQKEWAALDWLQGNQNSLLETDLHPRLWRSLSSVQEEGTPCFSVQFYSSQKPSFPLELFETQEKCVSERWLALFSHWNATDLNYYCR